MNVYVLDSDRGTMEECPMIEMNKKNCRVVVATLEEFESNEMMHPCKKDLLHSLNYEKYCKVEFFQDLFQGIIRSSVIKEKRQESFLFGFLLAIFNLLLQNDMLYLQEIDNGLEQREEKILVLGLPDGSVR